MINGDIVQVNMSWVDFASQYPPSAMHSLYTLMNDTIKKCGGLPPDLSDYIIQLRLTPQSSFLSDGNKSEASKCTCDIQVLCMSGCQCGFLTKK